MSSRTALAAKGVLDGAKVFGFKDSQAGVEDFTLGHDDHVEAWGDLVPTKNLSNQSFSSISLNRAAHLLGGGDSQTSLRLFPPEQEDRQVPAVGPYPARVDQLKFWAPAYPLDSPERRWHSRAIRC